jgi:TonB family protein
VIRDIVPWTVGPAVPLDRMLSRLHSEVPVGNADVVVAFAAERCEKLRYGGAWGFERFVLVQTGCLDTAMVSMMTADLVLSHEVAHLFGGFHPVAGVTSVMRVGPADRFDDQTARVIRLMRTYDFPRGVLGLDAETRRAWSAIYAEGHARNEPNLLAQALATAGWRELESGKADEGEALIREAMAMDPSGAHPHMLLGRLFTRQQRYDEAVRELRTATKLDFHLVQTRIDLGFLLRQLNRQDEALVEFRDAVRIDPRAGRAYLGIGMILADRGRLPEAVEVLQTATQMAPTDGFAYLQLATALSKSTRPTEAGVAAEQAQKLGQAVPPELLPRPDPVVAAPARSSTRSSTSIAAAPPPQTSRPPAPAASASALPVCPERPLTPESDAVVFLDDDSPRFQEYAKVLRAKIRPHWVYPRPAGERNIEGDLDLEFRISKEGRLTCAVVRRTSGTDVLDQAAMEAVRYAAPFPPLPDEVAPKTLGVTINFRYEIVSGLPNKPSTTTTKPSAPTP